MSVKYELGVLSPFSLLPGFCLCCFRNQRNPSQQEQLLSKRPLQVIQLPILCHLLSHEALLPVGGCRDLIAGTAFLGQTQTFPNFPLFPHNLFVFWLHSDSSPSAADTLCSCRSPGSPLWYPARPSARASVRAGCLCCTTPALTRHG